MQKAKAKEMAQSPACSTPAAPAQAACTHGVAQGAAEGAAPSKSPVAAPAGGASTAQSTAKAGGAGVASLSSLAGVRTGGEDGGGSCEASPSKRQVSPWEKLRDPLRLQESSERLHC